VLYLLADPAFHRTDRIFTVRACARLLRLATRALGDRDLVARVNSVLAAWQGGASVRCFMLHLSRERDVSATETTVPLWEALKAVATCITAVGDHTRREPWARLDHELAQRTYRAVAACACDDATQMLDEALALWKQRRRRDLLLGSLAAAFGRLAAVLTDRHSKRHKERAVALTEDTLKTAVTTIEAPTSDVTK
jgi:hypothetical protein